MIVLVSVVLILIIISMIIILVLRSQLCRSNMSVTSNSGHNTGTLESRTSSKLEEHEILNLTNTDSSQGMFI